MFIDVVQFWAEVGGPGGRFDADSDSAVSNKREKMNGKGKREQWIEFVVRDGISDCFG